MTKKEPTPDFRDKADILPSALPLRRRLGAGAIAAGLLFSAACSGESTADFTDNPEAIAEYTWYSGEYKTQDLNTDPRFRATTVSVMRNGTLSGSGSLVKQNGEYQFITVEHVARPMFGLSSNIENTGLGPHISVEEGVPAADVRIFVPGVGLFDSPDDPDSVTFSGKNEPTRLQNAVDRFAVIELEEDTQSIIAAAEESGAISVPELVSPDMKFGEQFFMPLADTGEKIPFVFVRYENDGSPTLVPLFMLDEDLDYDRGMEWLSQRINEVKADLDEKGQQYAEDTPLRMVVSEKAMEIAERYDNHAEEIAQWLPCNGDSGSPLVDYRGNVIGTLSSGTTFYGGNISREGRTINRSCQYDSTFARP